MYGCFSLDRVISLTNRLIETNMTRFITIECPDYTRIRYPAKLAVAHIYKTLDGKDVLVTSVVYDEDCKDCIYPDKILLGPVSEFVRSVDNEELKKFADSVRGLSKETLTERLKNYKPVE